jgi:hypothetical protein
MMPDLQEFIRLFREREATRPPGTPIRVIRSANLRTDYWRQDARYLVEQKGHGEQRREVARCSALAATGEHLDLDRVGLVVDSTSEAWEPPAPAPPTGVEIGGAP